MKTLVLFQILSSLLTGENNSWFFPEYYLTYLLFMLVGGILGCVGGYLGAKMPNFDYKEETFTLKQLLPCMVLWGIILAGIGFMIAHLYILSWIY